MSSAAGPWSVKGIDPKAREIAKDLARRQGMTLGEWLNQMIIDGGEPEAPPFERRPAYRDTPERRPLADSYGRLSAAAYEADEDDRSEEIARVTHALEALSARIEASEHRSTLAISGIDQHVMGVLSRLEGSERDSVAVASRFDGALQEIRDTQARVAERTRRLEQEDLGRAEAMKALEAALSKVAAQIYEGETRTRVTLNEVREDVSGVVRRVDRLEAPDGQSAVAETVLTRIADRLNEAEQRTSTALRALESSFAGLDARLHATESRTASSEVGDGAERRFERLAADLSDKVEIARTEMAGRMRAAADDKLDRMEATLRDLAGHVEQAERRSAQSIDRMGREVMRVAQTLGQRVANVETRASETALQMGGEMTRIADVMETRIRQADTAQAEALEKLGSEIARIAERLADRIAGAERRAGQTAEEVGEQLGKLLEDARESIDRRLTDNHRRAVMDAAVQADTFGHRAPEAEAAAAVFTDDGYVAPEYLPVEEEAPARELSTRELIEQARNAAREAARPEAKGRKGRAAAAASVPAPSYEPEAKGGFGFKFGQKKKKKEGSTLRTALLASGTAAILSMAVAGYGLLSAGRSSGDRDPTPMAPRAESEIPAVAAVPPAELTPPSETAAPDILANAVSPPPDAAAVATPPVQAVTGSAPAKPATSAAAPAPTPAATATSALGLYSAAVRQIETGDATGLASLRKAANLGYGPAQFYLAKLYESGGACLAKDPAEARRWTERAAIAGDPKAMHNLALYYFEGAGGAKSVATAADWFKRAAEQGLEDSQYNLARLYEQGYGVTQNPAEAYKWYLVASGGGDTEARNGAERTKKLISAEAQAAAERTAAQIRARPANPAAGAGAATASR